MCKEGIRIGRAATINAYPVVPPQFTPTLVARADSTRLRVGISIATNESFASNGGASVGTYVNGVFFIYGSVSPGMPTLTLDIEDLGSLVTSAIYVVNNSAAGQTMYVWESILQMRLEDV